MSTVAVDPRIRARRVSVARDAGRRRLRRVVAVGMVGALGLLALALTFTPLFDVEEVSVAGSARTGDDAVLEAAGVAPGDPLAWFDPGSARAALEALPWVASAEVRRSWKGSVAITVVEREAVAALVAPDGGYRLADGTGRVLATAPDLPGEVTLIEGIETAARPGEQLDGDAADVLAVAGGVPAALRPELATLVSGPDGVVGTLRAGGEILVGDPADADAKLAAAAAVLATVPPGCVDRLDVTLPSAPTLVRVAGC